VYRIIKWVKGIPYLYEQSSFRVGKSVKTQSRFLGRASHKDVRSCSDSTKSIPAIRAYNRRKEDSARKVITTNNILDNKINLEYYGISQQALQEEFKSFTDHLRGLGFDLSNLPQIRLRYGKSVAYKESLLRNYYIVTLPRGGRGHRTKFKTAFSHILARIALDLHREQCPEDYLKLASVFHQSYWVTQYALYTFILNSQDWKKRIKAFIFLWAGNTQLLEKVIPKNPQTIGLVDHSRRKDWKDEAVGIITHIERYRRDKTKMGFSGVEKDLHKELYYAKKDLHSAKVAYKQCFGTALINPYKKKAKKRILQADARLRSQEEFCRKVYLLQRIFYPGARL
jgi:hypothetical protein